MTETEARATLTEHGWKPGDGTRGLPPDAREAIKAAALCLAQFDARAAQEAAQAARAADLASRKPQPIVKAPKPEPETPKPKPRKRPKRKE